MFNTIENRKKIKAYDQMIEIWDHYLYVIGEGHADYRKRFLYEGASLFEDDEDQNIGYLLYELENIPNNFNWFDHVRYYATYYIISFDTKINKKKVDTIDGMKELYEKYKNNEYLLEEDNTIFKDKLIMMLTGKQKPQSWDELFFCQIIGGN
jgi:hypothetical protein